MGMGNESINCSLNAIIIRTGGGKAAGLWQNKAAFNGTFSKRLHMRPPKNVHQVTYRRSRQMKPALPANPRCGTSGRENQQTRLRTHFIIRSPSTRQVVERVLVEPAPLLRSNGSSHSPVKNRAWGARDTSRRVIIDEWQISMSQSADTC